MHLVHSHVWSPACIIYKHFPKCFSPHGLTIKAAFQAIIMRHLLLNLYGGRMHIRRKQAILSKIALSQFCLCIVRFHNCALCSETICLLFTLSYNAYMGYLMSVCWCIEWQYFYILEKMAFNAEKTRKVCKVYNGQDWSFQSLRLLFYDILLIMSLIWQVLRCWGAWKDWGVSRCWL